VEWGKVIRDTGIRLQSSWKDHLAIEITEKNQKSINAKGAKNSEWQQAISLFKVIPLRPSRLSS